MLKDEIKAAVLRNNYVPYYTPDNVAEELVRLAEIKTQNLILEPSCGEGAIVAAILRNVRNTIKIVNIVAIEPFADHVQKVAEIENVGNIVTICNFFEDVMFFPSTFDRIIANPPFNDDLWKSHLVKMLRIAKPGGIVVIITPSMLSWTYKEFEILNDVKSYEVIPIENWASKNTKIQILKIVK